MSLEISEIENELDNSLYEIVIQISQIQGDNSNISIIRPVENRAEVNIEVENIFPTPNPDDLNYNENKVQSRDVIEIKKENKSTSFFILANGHDPIYFNEKNDTEIGQVIEKYIINMKEKEEIRNTFYYGDKKIDDMSKTIQDLEIAHLGFVQSKLNN